MPYQYARKHTRGHVNMGGEARCARCARNLRYKAIRKPLNLDISITISSSQTHLTTQRTNRSSKPLYFNMHSQVLILAAMPLLARAVNIIQFAVWEDTPPNTECNLQLDGAYFMCDGIEAETCCANFWSTTNSILGSGLNNTQADGRYPDSFDVFNGEDGDPCAMTTASMCGGGGGFENFCWDTGRHCGAATSGGSMWHDGDAHPRGRFAKRAAAVKPNVAGIWDVGEGKHRQFSIGEEVPAEVATALVKAVKGNVEFKDLDESVKAFEITN
jgi:hypothetical protein